MVRAARVGSGGAAGSEQRERVSARANEWRRIVVLAASCSRVAAARVESRASRMAAIESLGELSVALSRSVTRARHRQVEDAVLLEKQPAQQTPAARLSLWRHHLEWLSQQTLERQAFVRVGERAPEMQLDGNDGDGGGGADGGAAVARSIERLQGEIDELQRQLYQLGAAYSNAQSTARRCVASELVELVVAAGTWCWC